MVQPIVDPAVWSERMGPTPGGLPVPPLPPVAQIDGPGCRPENQRTRHQVGGIRPGIQCRVELALGHSDVAAVVDEFGELRIGDRMPFHRELCHLHRVYRRLFRIEARRTHPERNTRQLDELSEHASWYSDGE